MKTLIKIAIAASATAYFGSALNAAAVTASGLQHQSAHIEQLLNKKGA